MTDDDFPEETTDLRVDLRRARRLFTEFDCPACDANNPYGDGFHAGDAIRCLTCGTDFDVLESPGTVARLRER